MALINRIDISPHLAKAPELRHIRDSLYSLRETLEVLQRKGLKTKDSSIRSQLFSLSCALGRCKNEERMYHDFNNMDRALVELKRELSVVTRLHQNLYEAQNYGFSPQVEQKAPEFVSPPEPRPTKPIVVVPRERPEVTAYLITVYDNIWGAVHSALYIRIQGEEPFLYDPNGSYLSGRRGSGAFFIGEDANLKAFVKYHRDKDGDDTTTRPMMLSKTQAKRIIEKAMELGEVGDFNCARFVSKALIEEYGLSDIYKLPIHLEEEVKRIEDRKFLYE